MKFLLAAAAAPLILAAAASAQDDADGSERRLIVNGQSYAVDETGDVSEIIERAAEADGPGRFVVSVDPEAGRWSDREKRAFAEAMRELASELAALDENAFAFAWQEESDWTEWADAHADEMRAHAEDMREHALEMAQAARAQAMDGERMRMVGIRAGEAGMRGGLAGIDEAIERGWTWEDGERRDLTEDEIQELEQARDDLEDELAEFREAHADILALAEPEAPVPPEIGEERRQVFVFQRDDADQNERREVRVERRGDEARVWLDGEELDEDEARDWLESDEAEKLLETPEPPRPPRAPGR